MSFAAWTAASCVCAQDVEIEGVQRRVDSFFDRLNSDETEDPSEAFDELLAGGPFARRSKEIESLVTKYKGLMGNEDNRFLESELIDEKRIGKDLILLKYLYKMEQFPVVWYFTFYRKPETTPWFVIAIRFDTRLELLGISELKTSVEP